MREVRFTPIFYVGGRELREFDFLVRLLREELQLLHEPGSYVGEVVKVMGKTKVLVKVQPEGKYSMSTPLVPLNDFH